MDANAATESKLIRRLDETQATSRTWREQMRALERDLR